MITAIDTSVLIAITKAEPDALKWTDLLARAQADGDLVVCDVVAAEFFAVLMTSKSSSGRLPRLA